MAATKLNTRQLAEKIHTDPRKLRKFMRATGHGVGQGHRYEVPDTKARIAALQRQYARWAKAAQDN